MQILRKITEEFWWDVARKCNYATVYHTPIWKEFAARTSPEIFSDATFGAVLDSGVRVVFPMTRTYRRGPFRWLISTFDGGYGGFIADGPVQPAEAAALYAEACSTTTYRFQFLANPFAPPLPEAVTSKLNVYIEEMSNVVPLDADFNTVYSRFSKGLQSAYKKGVKNGITIRPADTLEEYRAYFEAYRDAVDRWGGDENYGYEWHVFEQFYALTRIYPDNLKLWLMMKDGEIGGGRIVLGWGEHTIGWNGTARRDFLKLAATPVADITIVRDAVERGYRYFDLNTSALYQGVIEYKQRFAPTQIPVNVWRFENQGVQRAHQLYQQVRTRLSRRDHANVPPGSTAEQPQSVS